MKKLLFLFLLFVMLFISSSQTYEQQTLIPVLRTVLENKPMEEQLAKIEIPYGSSKVSMNTKDYYSFIEFIIRKGAHFVIFGLVAVAIYAVLQKIRFRYILALLITIGIAIVDEYRQLLTGERTPSLLDVQLDFFGAFTFLTCFVLLRTFFKKIRPSLHKRE